MYDAVKSMLLVFSAVAAGCSTVPEKNPALEQARSAYRSAASDPNVVAKAPVQLDNAQRSLQQAEKLWTEGGELAAVEHQAYLAEQRAHIAQQTAQLAVAEQAVADIGAERDKVLLQARTGEAERARSRAEVQTKEAEAARQAATQQAQSAQEAREIALMQAREAEAAQARVRKLESQLQELKAQKTERGYVLTLGGDVLFDVGKADLKPGAGRALNNLTRFLKENPERKTVIEGFTDSTGGDEYNQRLSERRAEAVKDALVAHGIESHRIAAKGHGEAFPVASNDTVAGRQLNRRVEVVISEDGGKVDERRR